MKIKIKPCFCKIISKYDCNKCHERNVEFTKSLNHYFGDGIEISRFFKRSHYKWKRKIKNNFINKLKKQGLK